MKNKKDIDGIINWFKTHLPDPKTELHYSDPYGLLVAVMLSAQCTDKRVNMTTPALLERFRHPNPWQLPRQKKYSLYKVNLLSQ